ncbi:MAG: hypothetical protein H0W24_02235 [Lysobacter sp.]|nr:hypothetical protein [Lysobacter sp.]MDQ3269475.1 hypothetical protein [Pseudomonadota bacterium]
MDKWIAMAGALALSLAASPVVLAAAAAETEQAEAAEPFLGGFLRETRIVYPLAVGARRAMGENRFDSPRDGVSVRYAESEDAEWIDVYIYPVGVLSPEDVRAAVESERQALEQHWLQGPGAKPGDISELRALRLSSKDGGGKETTPAWSLDFTLEVGGIRRNSAMVVAFDNLYLVKARYSTVDPRVSRRQIRRGAEAFVKALLPQLTISSTGRCWQPLPIETLADGPAVPDGSMLSLSAQGETTVYVFPDRVLATERAGAGTMAAMLAGMAMLGRLHSGCDGAESLNPEVPEGMREIRIDYRGPAGNAPPVRSPSVRPVEVG